jgi:hypothetical protein
MKVLILLDPNTNRIVRAYSQYQTGFVKTIDNDKAFPNCEKHLVEIGVNTQSSPAKLDIPSHVLGVLNEWEGFHELLEETDPETLEEIKLEMQKAFCRTKRHKTT